MSSSPAESRVARALSASITEDALTIDLVDGRSISAPLDWYPRLAHSSAEERNNWRLVGSGEGIHWPELDEDVSVESLLAGRASSESQTSFQRWLQSRAGLANSDIEADGLPPGR